MALSVGDVFATRFRLLAEIGDGGFGKVYAAEDHGARRVALKTMHAGLFDHPLAKELFVRESRIASAVDHPNVVGFIEGRVDDAQ